MEELALKAHHLKALDGLAAMGFATNDHLTRFSYAETSYTLMTTATKRLTEAGYIRKTRRILKFNEQVFYLAPKGRRYLISNEAPDVPQIPANVVSSWLFQEHTLAINETLLYARELARIPGIALDRFLLDRQLKRDPIAVPMPQGSRRYIPDAWCELTLAGRTPPRRCILFEVDRGTEEEETWRQKIATILFFLRRPMAERFGTDRATVAVWVAPIAEGEKRLAKLMEWTGRELAAQRAESWAGLFLFSAEHPNELNGTRFFLLHRWQTLTAPAGEPLVTF